MLLSSNQFLLSLAYPVLPTLYPPSIKISDRRIQYLGHRRGAPRAHWPELSLAEAHNKLRLYETSPPNPGAFLHPFYSHFTIVELKSFSSTNMINWYNTTQQLHALLPVAEDRELWKHLSPKMK